MVATMKQNAPLKERVRLSKYSNGEKSWWERGGHKPTKGLLLNEIPGTADVNKKTLLSCGGWSGYHSLWSLLDATISFIARSLWHEHGCNINYLFKFMFSGSGFSIVRDSFVQTGKYELVPCLYSLIVRKETKESKNFWNESGDLHPRYGPNIKQIRAHISVNFVTWVWVDSMRWSSVLVLSFVSTQ